MNTRVTMDPAQLSLLLFLTGNTHCFGWSYGATLPENVMEIKSEGDSLTPDHFIEGAKLKMQNPPRELCTIGIWNQKDGKNQILTQDLNIKKWPGAIVYYDLRLTDTSGKYTTLSEKQKIQKVTYLVFMEYTNATKLATNFIQIRRSIEYNCASSIVGMSEPGTVPQPKAQYIYLSDACFSSTGTIFHELLHAVGFHHEHSRLDRGNYIEIHEKNIHKELISQFNKHPPPSGNYNGLYDLGLLMHYAPGAAASSGNAFDVLKNVTLPNVGIGQRLNFTSEDVKKINSFYECNKNPHTLRQFQDVEYLKVLKGLNCRDSNPKCKIWAKQNFCQDHRVLIYMSTKCRKSCNICKL